MLTPDGMPSLIETAETLLQDGVRLIADLVDRILKRITGLVPLALSFGCQTATPEAPVAVAVAPPVVVVPADAAVAPVVEEPKPIGKFSITFYYVVGEEEIVAKPKAVAANDNQPPVDQSDAELAAIAKPELTTLFARNGGACEAISEVSHEFASQLRIQGSGKLRDGRVLNIWGYCPCPTSPCFKVTSAQWGTAGNGRQLHPFRTVAVDPKVIKLGTLLYVPLLEGKTMPGRAPWGGFVHDGCVVADDVGGGIKGNQLDLFVGRKGWFLGMSKSRSWNAWATQEPVFDGSKRCQRTSRNVQRKAGAI